MSKSEAAAREATLPLQISEPLDQQPRSLTQQPGSFCLSKRCSVAVVVLIALSAAGVASGVTYWVAEEVARDDDNSRADDDRYSYSYSYGDDDDDDDDDDDGLDAHFEERLAAAAAAAAPGATVFIGDSDVENWRTSGAAVAGSANVGVGGATCDDVIAWVPRALDKLAPAELVVVCGENDLDGRRAVTNATFLELEGIYRLAAPSVARVYMLSTKPEPSTTALHAEYRAYDALCAKLAASEAGGFVFIDSYGGFEDLGNPATLYDDDALHLSAAGYSHWDNWLSLARAAGGSCYRWRSGVCVGDVPQ